MPVDYDTFGGSPALSKSYPAERACNKRHSGFQKGTKRSFTIFLSLYYHITSIFLFFICIKKKHEKHISDSLKIGGDCHSDN